MIKFRSGSTKSFITLVFKSVLPSYSNIFFSNKRLPGIIILLTTFLYPLQGIFGLLGALLGSIWAYIFGADRVSIKNGYFGFNGVLVGLGIGYFFAINTDSIIFLLLITLFLTLLSISMNHLFFQYFGFPSMSMPFNITISLVILAGEELSRLTPAWNLSIINIKVDNIPDITAFLSSFSAILFQPNPMSGFFIAAAILIHSRIAFILMTAGYLTGLYLHNLSGLDISIITEKFLSFNYMYAALAIGGVFSIPSIGSLILGLLASAVTVIITAGCLTLFPDSISPLAFPFNITVYLFLYAMRISKYPLVNANSVYSLSPEESLRKLNGNFKQWRKPPITISLPFYGRWKVTQGIKGKITHKENWAFAYDFQAVDFNGRINKSDGMELNDYYSFGLPIIAPLGGKVYCLRNDVSDNQIGKININENWGNYIIIEHGNSYYSCLAHLKEKSIKVTAGQEIKKGEILAACGNSGRSPYPHIHLQFQSFPQLGSPSIGFEFSNLIVDITGKDSSVQAYIQTGIIEEGFIVRNMTPAIDYEKFFPYSLNQVWTYKYCGKKQESMEFWQKDIDFYGNTIIKSSPKISKIYYCLSEGVLSIKSFDGDQTTSLSLMGSLISEIPFIADSNKITWKAFNAVRHGIHPIINSIMDVLSLVGFNLMTSRSYIESSKNDEIILNIKSSLYLKIMLFTFRLKDLPDVEIVFKSKIGLKTLKIGNREVVSIC